MKKQERKDLIDEVRKTINEYHLFTPGESVLLGVSGGADSVCLTEVMCALAEELGIRLMVVHVDHGIRESAGRDAAFVRAMAERRGLPFYLKEADVPALRAEWRCSMEDAARRARYDAFDQVMKETGAEKLALAHHRDDQAETLLLHLCRGAGLRGMAGMAPIRGEIVRPLLYVSRSEITAYLAEKGLSHVEDETNASDAYTRNRVRRHLIPLMEEIHPGAAKHLSDATARVREALQYIDDETAKGLERCRTRTNTDHATPDAEPGNGIDLRSLRREPPFLQGEILLAALREQGLHADIGERHLDALKSLIAEDDGTQSLDLPGGIRAVRRYGILFFEREVSFEKSDGSQTGWMGEEGFVSAGPVTRRIIDRVPGTPFDRTEIPADPFTKWFDFDKIKQSLCVRTRRSGDWIDAGNGLKSLKKEMIDRKIPADERDGIPLLAAGDEILWVIGHRRSEAYRVTDETARILEVRASGRPSGSDPTETEIA